jgi:hypothetical protein
LQWAAKGKEGKVFFLEIKKQRPIAFKNRSLLPFLSSEKKNLF